LNSAQALKCGVSRWCATAAASLYTAKMIERGGERRKNNVSK
jgi:hypothetical protein